MPQLEFSPEFLKQLAKAPRVIKERVRKITLRLADWPDVSGAKALTGNLAGWYRIRTGDYRIRFRVEGERLIVEKLGHRKDFYED